MYNTISKAKAAELDGKEISVRDFLATDWTDHVYLVPDDIKERKFWVGSPLTCTREDSMKLLSEKYIDNQGVYIIREKDFGDNIVAYWIYFGVIVPAKEYEEARKKEFGL